MSRFCEQCGKRLEVNESFCPYCGAKVELDETPSPSVAEPTSSPPVVDNSFEKLILGIFGGIGIIFFIVMLVSAGGNSSKEYQSDNYATKTQGPVETTRPPASLTESDFRIGDLGLTSATNKTDLDKRFGAGKVKDYGWYDYGDFWAKFDSGGIAYWLSCMSANLSTPRGVRCGALISDVTAAYGNNYKVDGNNFEYSLNDLVLIFHLNAGKVKEIVLVKKDVASPTPPISNQNTAPVAAKPKVSDEYNYSCTVDGGTTYKGIKRLGLACALYSVEKQKRITSDFGLNHTARGTFYIVTVIVGNGTNEPIFVPSIYLIDDRGRKFSGDISAGATWHTMHGVESAFQLNPGQPGWLYEIFDVPDDANIVSLRCEAELTLEDNKFNVPFRVVTE